MTEGIFVDVSARHVHITPEDVSTLFGPGVELTRRDTGGQRMGGMALYLERVEIIGPSGSIENVSILGPFREYRQVEVSKTDSRKLGLNPPCRESGDLEGSPGCRIVGPYGELELNKGVIVAQRHLHINEEDAAKFQVKNGDSIQMEIQSDERSLVFGDIVVRTRPKIPTTLHIDTDEANAAGISSGAVATIFRREDT